MASTILGENMLKKGLSSTNCYSQEKQTPNSSMASEVKKGASRNLEDSLFVKIVTIGTLDLRQLVCVTFFTTEM